MTSPQPVSIRELARRAAVNPAAAFRAVRHGIFPVKNPAAAKRLQTALNDLNLATGRNACPASQKATQGHVHAVQSARKTPDGVATSGASPEAATNQPQEDSMLLRSESLTQAAKKQFGLVRNPFADDIHCRADVFVSPALRYCRAALFDAALNHGFIALIGESGSGKSTLAEELEQKILDEGRSVIIIRPYVLAMEENDTKGKTLKSSAIAEAIIRSLDPSASPRRTADARFRQVHELLKASRAAGNSHLILIEEAHCLPIPTLKHLKRFLELKQGLSRLLGVALIGQPELALKLSEHKPEVREVAQRCELIQVPPLDGDLEGYLAHKFDRAGAKSADALAPDAIDAIRARLIRVPRGGKAADAESLCYPLVVGNLVTRALNAAAAAGWPKVDAQVIGGC
ncbi:MAG: AAA family ATPase [Zoogloeaceae bacterium]|jgi:type II secretory pathway predicted ATPase ExeA|nr:AAA family ATPase [Zoogloeaceae bacterium]